MMYEPLKLKCPDCGELIDVDFYDCPHCNCNLDDNNQFNTVEIEITNSCGGERNGLRRGIENEMPIYSPFILKDIQDYDYDYDEVYNIQCEYVGYLILKQKLKSNKFYFSIIFGMDTNGGIRDCSGLTYLLNNEYLIDFPHEDFSKIVKEEYSNEDIRYFLSDYDIHTESDDREELLKLILNNPDERDFLFSAFKITDKGYELLNNPSLQYFTENFENEEYYYRFKLLCDENPELSFDEVKLLLIRSQKPGRHEFESLIGKIFRL